MKHVSSNYIHRLQADVETREEQRTEAAELVQEFLEHLAGPKFAAEGDRWISTDDVRERLLSLRSALLPSA